jgi:hypothetical protein
MFQLKCSFNYNIICKVWWNRYNKTNELFFSFYLLERTYSFTADAANVHHLLKDKLLPLVCFCVLYSYLLLLGQVMHYWLIHEEEQTILMWSIVQEWIHVLLVNAPYTIFTPTQLSCNLCEKQPSNQMTSTWVSQGRLGEAVTLVWTHFLFNFFTVLCDCFHIAF